MRGWREGTGEEGQERRGEKKGREGEVEENYGVKEV